jgi:hypothetical protein
VISAGIARGGERHENEDGYNERESERAESLIS